MSSLVVPTYLPFALELQHPLPPVDDTMLVNLHESFGVSDLPVCHRFVGFSTREHEDDIREQISNLGKLQDGWLDGTGKACDPGELDNLADKLIRHYPLDAPELRLYPTGDGNVQAEWWIGNYSAVLEIFLDGTAAAEWSDYNFQRKQENARPVNINHEQDWEWVVQRLQSFS